VLGFFSLLALVGADSAGFPVGGISGGGGFSMLSGNCG
jgi:hypothetical protein